MMLPLQPQFGSDSRSRFGSCFNSYVDSNLCSGSNSYPGFCLHVGAGHIRVSGANGR